MSLFLNKTCSLIMQKVLSICLALIISTCAFALPAHPYFITIGGGAGYNDWGPIIGHNYGEQGGMTGGADVFTSSPTQAGGFDATGTAGFGLEISQHFKIQADYFYFSPTEVHFHKQGTINYPKLATRTNRNFKTHAQAGDLSMVVAINLMQRFDLGAYVGAGIGLVNRKDILANTNRYGGSFSAGLTHRLSKNFSSSLGLNYFTGYDKAEVRSAESYMPFLYSTHFSLIYNFG